MYIEFDEIFHLADSFHQLANQWQQVAVLNRYFVQAPVVHADSQGSVFLFGEYDRCAAW